MLRNYLNFRTASKLFNTIYNIHKIYMYLYNLHQQISDDSIPLSFYPFSSLPLSLSLSLYTSLPLPLPLSLYLTVSLSVLFFRSLSVSHSLSHLDLKFRNAIS